MAKTIDCTPTWAGMVNWYMKVLEEGNEEAKKPAREELRNMARIADQYNVLVKEMKAKEAQK